MDNQLLMNTMINNYISPSITISDTLLLNYSKINMTDTELVFWLKLMYVSQYGQQPLDFNIWSDKLNMTLLTFLDLFNMMQTKGFITTIEQTTHQGIDTFIDFSPLFKMLLPLVAVPKQQQDEKQQMAQLFTAIEKEFGRPLSSRDIEIINSWLDKDKLSPDLIMYALKEAVIAKKVSIKYIDRILLDWYKAGITNYDQIENHTQKYRSQNIKKISQQTAPEVEFIDWLNGEE